jgi:branched-chain amino acid transport system permease protein
MSGAASSPVASPASATEAIAQASFDLLPLALVAALMLLAWPAIGATSTWVTLTVAGLAMGMIIFIIASGLTLVFGLMDVLNFGHGVFIAIGAYLAVGVFAGLADWSTAADVAKNLIVVVAAMFAGALAAGVVGIAFERLLLRPVYGQHLKQILITMGGMIVGEEVIKLIWGPTPIALELPDALRGVFTFGDIAVEKFRLLAAAIGSAIFIVLLLVLNRTKLGLLIRAGVQDREMVESLGYPIRRLFVGVFVAGAALAGLGGALWGINQHGVSPQIGTSVNVLIFIVIIVGGLGSTSGCFVGALLVGLMANYTGFLEPKVAMFSNIGLMVLILLWRPQGLYPVTNR